MEEENRETTEENSHSIPNPSFNTQSRNLILRNTILTAVIHSYELLCQSLYHCSFNKVAACPKKPCFFQTSESKAPAFKNWDRQNQGLIVANFTIKEWVNNHSLRGLDSISISATAGTFDFFDQNRAAHLHSWNWCLFTTVSGHVGIGPSPCQPGDKVVVIFSCASPLVVRSMGSHHELMGEYYVHGIMHGEAVQDALRREHEMAVDFEIR